MVSHRNHLTKHQRDREQGEKKWLKPIKFRVTTSSFSGVNVSIQSIAVREPNAKDRERERERASDASSE